MLQQILPSSFWLRNLKKWAHFLITENQHGDYLTENFFKAQWEIFMITTIFGVHIFLYFDTFYLHIIKVNFEKKWGLFRLLFLYTLEKLTSNFYYYYVPLFSLYHSLCLFQKFWRQMFNLLAWNFLQWLGTKS